MFFALVVVLALVASVAGTVFNKDVEHQKFMWEQFKTEHFKEYNSGEDQLRFGYFIENLKKIDERNLLEQKAGGTAVHGINKFADLSEEEFRSRYLTADIKLKTNNAKVASITKAPASTGLVDWTGVYTTPVKDQGHCGSCWAFSATEQVESDSMRTLGTSYVLSPEQITQCDKTSSGCNGGWTEHAYNYLSRTGGIEQESDYPYTSYFGVTGSCSSDSSKFVISVSDYTTINGESAMASYVQSTGPLSVCVDANNWSSYTGGIMKVCGKQVDHCVQAVGVDVAGGYWKVRNSWGTGWGESGYIQLAYGANTCDITSDPTFVSVGTV